MKTEIELFIQLISFVAVFLVVWQNRYIEEEQKSLANIHLHP